MMTALSRQNLLEHVKQGMQRAWSKGDYARIAQSLVLESEQLCESVGVRWGDRVLDIGTGSGNTALAAARRGAMVTGVDFADLLLTRAHERATAETLPAQFRFADAERLPFAAESFDVVVSSFGLMFAPDWSRAVAEAFRVLKPGGRFGHLAWTQSGLIGQMCGVLREYAPLPLGVECPMLWGREPVAASRLEGHVDWLQTRPRFCYWRAESAGAWVELMIREFGPARAVFEYVSPAERGEILWRLTEIVRGFNDSGESTLLARVAYLEITAVKK
jgi:ubiquinone/menaquinone biosynthesis C-methylase UbiE